jgi:hypothetical protein
MKIECNEGGAWAVVIVGVVACISAAFTISLAAGSGAKFGCYKAQQAAYAASAPKIPECR